MKNISKTLFSLLLFSSVALAENDQSVVIGLGLGLHRFSTTDDLRESAIFDEISYAGASNLYVEWYALEELGIGLRLNGLGVTESIWTSTSTYDREFSISNTFITLNWIPYGATGYTRIGILAGLGNSEYEYAEKIDGFTAYKGTSEGPASLFGGFVDWGGEDFGARFSLNFIKTDLGDLSGYKVDASGTYWTFDLRWAFK